MNKHQPLVAKLTAVALALALAGCDSTSDYGKNVDKTPPPPPAPAPTPTPTPTPPPEPETGGEWTLVWSDEFDGDAVDETKWEYEVNCWGGGNGEQQCYTDREKNAYVEDGALKIVAYREDFTGPSEPSAVKSASARTTAVGETTLPYTSARLRTLNKGDWTYGRFEIRAKMPHGQGTWPAIWMLPTDWVYGGWAASGEIDIMESVNLKTQSDEEGAEDGDLEARIHASLHYGKAWPDNVSATTSYKLPEGANPADDFHTYAIEWEQGEIRWYVDGEHYATQREDSWYSHYMEDGELVAGEGDAPFNQKFHMLLNLAVGGAWAGAVNDTGIDESVFPQTMEVDYVRVYECSVSPSTGGGCATIGDNAELVEGPDEPVIDVPETGYGAGPLYTIYDDALDPELEYLSYNPDGSVSYEEVEETDRGMVLVVDKAGEVGNLYFEYAPHLDMSNWIENNGHLVFDLYIESMDPGVSLLVKIDSGWPNLSDFSVDLPAVGEWKEIRMPVADIVDNGNSLSPGASVNINNVANPFVVEPLGKMVLRLDNIRYEYAEEGEPEPEPEPVPEPEPTEPLTGLVIYEDADVEPYMFGNSGGAIDVKDVDVGSTHGMVKQVTWNNNETVTYWQSSSTADLSEYTHVKFDLNVVTDPRSTRDFKIKMDCVYPCGSGDYTIDAPEIGVWTSYSVAIADLVSNPGSTLDLTKVDTPLVIFPAWGNQNGVVMQIDNVHLINDGAEPLAQIDLPVTFEDSTVNYTLSDFGGTVSELVDDPAGGSQGVVAKTTKPAGSETWAGTTIGTGTGFATPVPITTTNSTMTVWVYSPDAGIPIRLKLEDHSNNKHTVETEATTTVANAWEMLTFDFNNVAPGTEPFIHDDWIFDKASIFFNFGTSGNDAGEKVYYFDDVEFGG